MLTFCYLFQKSSPIYSAKNIKLITLPYCPSNYSITGGLLSFDEGWNYSGGALFLENLNTKFKNEVVTDLPSLNHYMLD